MTFQAAPGVHIGPYEIVTQLGQGGMAQVLLARDRNLDRTVALKLLSPELAEDPDFRARFLREARVAAALEHPNVVPVYDTGEFEGLLYIAMRYVAGADLRKTLEGGPISPERALHLLAQVASALDAAHSAGLVHRDVKPANVLLSEPPEPGSPEHAYLVDFGLAWQPVLADARTEPGLILGTVDYAAPEQLQGRPLDGRADVYALGAVLYECLTGVPPYHRDSAVATIAAHLHEAPPRPSEARPELAPALDAVVAQALAKAREDRHRTCTELIEAAREALRGAAAASVFVPRRAGDLPLPLTSLIAREEELGWIVEAVRRTRLLTLVGVGGAGKTRVGIEAARALEGEGARVAFVEVGSLGPGEVSAAVDGALATAGDTAAGLNELLVLDECERHADELRIYLEHLLIMRGTLRALVTSREPLRILGEQIYTIAPLRVPDDEDDAVETPAGRLFWERALAADPSLRADTVTRRSVASICRSLDGIPLALELAAARIRSLPLGEIERRIASSSALLSDRAAAGRHRSMTSVIGWSHDLLSEPERVVFRRLGVFSGNFELADAEVVAGNGDVPPDAVLDLLARLVERSLVVLRRDGGRARYRLLAPIARYAAERLASSGEEAVVRRRHAERFLRPLVESGGSPATSASEAWSAVRWASSNGSDDLARVLAGRAAVALGGWREATELLEGSGGDDDPLVLEALGVALCKLHRGDPTGGEYARGQRLLRESYGLDHRLATLAALAGTWKGVDEGEAHRTYAEAIERDPADPYALGNLLEYEIEEAGDLLPVHERAPQIERALERCRVEIAEGRNLPWARYDLGKLLALLGEPLPSMGAFVAAAVSSPGSHPVETSQRSMERLAAVAGPGSACDLAAQLLSLVRAVRSSAADCRAQATAIATGGAASFEPPAVIVVGDSSQALHAGTVARSAALIQAFEGFRGTVISGGTTTGVSAVVGDLNAAIPGARSVGYVPSELPTHVRVDEERYDEVRRTPASGFGAAEPLRYWADLLASGVMPRRICVLGIGGGELAAFEYRLGLVLGASVGILRESGREGSELLTDPVWSGSPRLFEVPADAAGVRSFLQRHDVLL